MDYEHELYHYGILGMKWGIRRYQNPDGTLTEEGKKRYGAGSSVSKKEALHILKSSYYDDHTALKRIREKLPKNVIEEIDNNAEKAYDTALEDYLVGYNKMSDFEKDKEFAKELESSIRSMSADDIKNVLIEYNTSGREWNDASMERISRDVLENASYKHFVDNYTEYIPQKHKEEHNQRRREMDRLAEELAKDYVLKNGDSPVPKKAQRGVNSEATMMSDIIRNAARYNGFLDFQDPSFYSKEFVKEDLYYYFADSDHQYSPAVSPAFKNEIIKKLEQIPELRSGSK